MWVLLEGSMSMEARFIVLEIGVWVEVEGATEMKLEQESELEVVKQGEWGVEVKNDIENENLNGLDAREVKEWRPRRRHWKEMANAHQNQRRYVH